MIIDRTVSVSKRSWRFLQWVVTQHYPRRNHQYGCAVHLTRHWHDSSRLQVSGIVVVKIKANNVGLCVQSTWIFTKNAVISFPKICFCILLCESFPRDNNRMHFPHILLCLCEQCNVAIVCTLMTCWGHECSLFVGCCVRNGLCDELITRSEESYQARMSNCVRSRKLKIEAARTRVGLLWHKKKYFFL